MTGKPSKRPTEAKLRALYKKHSMSEIADILGCHRLSVRTWALRYGIVSKKRPYSYDIPSGRKLRKLSSTLTDNQLASKFGCTEQTIRTRRHASGIFRSRARRRYTLNESFFEKIDTEHKAYVLGLLAADGTVNVRSVWLMLHAKDEHILRDVRKAMGSNARIFERKIARHPDCGPYKYIYFGSQKIVADLANHGVTPRKSFSLKYPTTLPRNLERHYMRGLLDGDGSVTKGSFKFLGTEALIDAMRASIISHTGIALRKCTADKLWNIVGCRGSKFVLSWIYKDATIFLRRKHRVFLEHWQ